MNKTAAITKPSAGRPTREQAEARHALLRERAIEHFLEKGFDRATVEAIAADVNMTKRTVYARYADKESLFSAALQSAIERFAVSRETIEMTQADDLEQTLVNIAMLRIDLIATPEGLGLQRIINTESYRFPEIFTAYYEIAALPTVAFLTEVLSSETEAGRIAIDQPELAANTFMSMVVSGPVRFITSGNPLSRREIDERVRFAVRLFLDGARPR